MPAASKRKSSRDRVKTHREKMRAKGYRLVQFWVPDTRTAEFKREMHRQSLAIANSPSEADDQAFIDAISEFKF